MDFENKMPNWENAGDEPSETLQKTGFQGQKRLPANILNWLVSLFSKGITEIQNKLNSHSSDQSNPHEVTKSQIGLGNVDNVKQASKSEFDSLVVATEQHSLNKNNPHKVTAEQVGAKDIKNRGTLIPNNADLDSYLTVGTYYVPDATAANTLKNTPIKGKGFKMTVEQLYGIIGGHLLQKIVTWEGNTYCRQFSGDAWSEWVKFVNDVDLKNNINYHATKQLTNEDLNTVLTSGFYYATGSNACINSPAPSGSGFGLEVVQSAGAYYTQLCYVANVVHIRYYNGGVWNEWKEIYGENNKPTAADIGALPVSGGTLTGSSIAFRNGLGKVTVGDDFLQTEAYKTAGDVNNRRVLALKSSNDIGNCFQLVDWTDGTSKYYKIYGENNKPSGSYKGNGTFPRTINIGGTGSTLMVSSDNGMCLITNRGAFCKASNSNSIVGRASQYITFYNGVLTINSDNSPSSDGYFNAEGLTYWYEVL